MKDLEIIKVFWFLGYLFLVAFHLRTCYNEIRKVVVSMKDFLKFLTHFLIFLAGVLGLMVLKHYFPLLHSLINTLIFWVAILYLAYWIYLYIKVSRKTATLHKK